jgi:hypothetical protein
MSEKILIGNAKHWLKRYYEANNWGQYSRHGILRSDEDIKQHIGLHYVGGWHQFVLDTNKKK